MSIKLNHKTYWVLNDTWKPNKYPVPVTEWDYLFILANMEYSTASILAYEVNIRSDWLSINSSAKSKNQSWSTRGGSGPPGPPGPPWSTLVHIFGKISKSMDQNGLELTRWTTGTTTPLGGPGAFRTTVNHVPTFSWWPPQHFWVDHPYTRTSHTFDLLLQT